ncbi:hypothetical protein AVEN_228597-1 [Araneus ventricosus]|uniref:Uncharacterized protein n=1 Tax=Araneus ventricosus TaxID=182803 RepID=A0A4Y2P2K6_ARAVE|nr:hypothetical protein AVEN_228597-1 [Araneus ventricosus]
MKYFCCLLSNDGDGIPRIVRLVRSGSKYGVKKKKRTSDSKLEEQTSSEGWVHLDDRFFVTWTPHGISDVRGGHEDVSFQNAHTTSDKLEDKQRCRDDKPSNMKNCRW